MVKTKLEQSQEITTQLEQTLDVIDERSVGVETDWGVVVDLEGLVNRYSEISYGILAACPSSRITHSIINFADNMVDSLHVYDGDEPLSKFEVKETENNVHQSPLRSWENHLGFVSAAITYSAVKQVFEITLEERFQSFQALAGFLAIVVVGGCTRYIGKAIANQVEDKVVPGMVQKFAGPESESRFDLYLSKHSANFIENMGVDREHIPVEKPVARVSRSSFPLKPGQPVRYENNFGDAEFINGKVEELFDERFDLARMDVGMLFLTCKPYAELETLLEGFDEAFGTEGPSNLKANLSLKSKIGFNFGKDLNLEAFKKSDSESVPCLVISNKTDKKNKLATYDYWLFWGEQMGEQFTLTGGSEHAPLEHKYKITKKGPEQLDEKRKNL